MKGDMSLIWGSPAWSWAALALACVGVAALAWSYWRAPSTGGVKLIAMTLKTLGLAGLALCLVEPLVSGTRARRGANMFAVVVDNSQSMSIHDRNAAESRGQQVHELLKPDTAWQKQLSEDFDVRRFAFDAHVRSVDDFSSLTFDGARSSLAATLNSLSRRFHGLPAAGVLLVTDGNATDSTKMNWSTLPPVYPVVVGGDELPADLSLAGVSVSQTNFESAPVTVRADVLGSGLAGEPVTATLVGDDGKELQSQKVEMPADGEPLALRFQLRPERNGVNFYRVRVAPVDAAQSQAAEATLANNERVVVVDRGGGPYRVLYVCGRPNWEFAFLRRALNDDDQLELLGLVRIARREPKFSFRSKAGESTNPLFRGFEHPDEESAEQYDQPVLIRLGTRDENELRDGFPKTAEELYGFDAIVLDDVEAGFFSQDQLSLLQNFVSRRGGGLLMLGGPDSFAAGRYARTPVGNLLPVYVGESAAPSARGRQEYRLALTREGWLQPWVRLRETEPEERKRLSAMAPFRMLTPIERIKPAATVLAEVVDEDGTKHPALVAQRFGRGRSAALLVGDSWRWAMRRPNDKENDLAKSWRQTVRWLVADMPRRVEVDIQSQEGSAIGAVTLSIRVRDPEYLPLDNAQVAVEVTMPDGKTLVLDTEPHENEAGAYVATHVPRQPGAYRAAIKVTAPDGSPVGEREAGWVAQPAADEFKTLRPNRAWLEEVAGKTGGEVIAADKLDELVASLPTRKAPITEPWIRPAWNHPLFYLAILGCLVGEWGLRRWKGLA
jgi:hypothetical protein